ncbi:MAG: hypothetical protein ACXVQ3_06620 [Gaiellaceae bacterium]
MADVLETIQAMISSKTRDLDQIERTLTDGYAEALSLEAKRWRLERRIAAATQGVDHGDTAKNARELASLAKELDGNVAALTRLRATLAQLRSHAHGVRVGSPART